MRVSKYMKLNINKNNLNMDPEVFMRRHFSYIMINNRHTGKDSFVRTLTRNRYPRLHMYIKPVGDNLIFDLHLDQKEPSYGGQHAHNAEYDSPIVEAEIARLRQALGLGTNGEVSSTATEAKSNSKTTVAEQKKASDQIGSGQYDRIAIPVKKSFWKKLFS